MIATDKTELFHQAHVPIPSNDTTFSTFRYQWSLYHIFSLYYFFTVMNGYSFQFSR